MPRRPAVPGHWLRPSSARGVYGDGGELSLMQPGGEPLRVRTDPFIPEVGPRGSVGPVRCIARGCFLWNVWMEKGEPGEGRERLKKGFPPFPRPIPPLPKTLTGGEAARREFRWMRRQLDEEAEFRLFLEQASSRDKRKGTFFERVPPFSVFMCLVFFRYRVVLF